MSDKGFTVGKFMPFHLGHRLLFEIALKHCDYLTIFIDGKETDEIPVSVRFNWLHEYAATCQQGAVNIVHIDPPLPHPDPKKIDSNGTSIDEDFWKQWIEYFENYDMFGATFFSSDWYGEQVALRMSDKWGATKWMPIDIEREVVPISATKIRNNLQTFFKYLAPETKQYFTKKICVVGAESSGKSTLIHDVIEAIEENNGESYLAVNEWGRTVSMARHNKLDENDFYDICINHKALIDYQINSSLNTSGIILVDTDAFTTELYAEKYLKHSVSERLASVTKYFEMKYDGYILVHPLPWVDDGIRIMPDMEERNRFVNRLRENIINKQVPFIEIIDSNQIDRVRDVCKFILECTMGE